MVQYVNFPSTNGYAVLDDVTFGGNTAIEMYIQTTSTGTQSLAYAVSRGFRDIITGGFILYLVGDQVSIAYGHTLPPDSFQYTSPDTTCVTDGNWHHLAVWLNPTSTPGQQTMTIYKDGVQVDQATVNIPYTISGGALTLGAVSNSILSAPFTGNISEVRVWSTNGNFIPQPWYPVAVDAPNLTNYWPFWVNYQNGTNDVAAGSGNGSPTFSGCALAQSSDQYYYDPFSEAMMNTPYGAFPEFTTGNQPQAVSDILKQLQNQRLIGPNIVTADEFRSLYLNNNNNFNDMWSMIQAMPNPGLGQDFTTVQQQFLQELQVVTSLYSYEAAATSFTTQYLTIAQTQIGAALNAAAIPMSSTVSLDDGAAFEVAKSAVELIVALAAGTRGGTKAKEDDDDGEDMGSAALGLIQAVIQYSIAQNTPNMTLVTYQANEAMSGTASQLSQMVEQRYNQFLGNLSQSVSQILKDWGKMNAILQKPNGLYFQYAMNNSMSQAITNTLAGQYCIYILASAYTCWEFCNNGGYGYDVLNENIWNADLLNEWLVFYGEGPGYADFAICNFNAGAYSLSVINAPTNTATSFLQNAGLNGNQVIFHPAFPQSQYIPQIGPGGERTRPAKRL